MLVTIRIIIIQFNVVCRESQPKPVFGDLKRRFREPAWAFFVASGLLGRDELLQGGPPTSY